MKKPLYICILALLAIAISACAPAATAVPTQAATEAPVQAPTPTSLPATAEPAATEPVAVNALFQIVKPDGTKFAVTLDAVKTLALAQITVEGKVQEGPKLLDLLSLAGITDFSEVTLTGSSAASTLTREQVDDNTILDFSNRGTMKLATTYIPKANWTKDITEITVK